MARTCSKMGGDFLFDARTFTFEKGILHLEVQEPGFDIILVKEGGMKEKPSINSLLDWLCVVKDELFRFKYKG